MLVVEIDAGKGGVRAGSCKSLSAEAASATVRASARAAITSGGARQRQVVSNQSRIARRTAGSSSSAASAWEIHLGIMADVDFRFAGVSGGGLAVSARAVYVVARGWCGRYRPHDWMLPVMRCAAGLVRFGGGAEREEADGGVRRAAQDGAALVVFRSRRRQVVRGMRTGKTTCSCAGSGARRGWGRAAMDGIAHGRLTRTGRDGR